MKNVGGTLVRDAVLGIWFALAALAFWGPYGGLPPLDGTPLYALFLTASSAALALRAARARRQPEGAQHG